MVKKFRTLDDLERDREIEKQEEFKKKFSKDIRDVWTDIFREPKKPPKKSKNYFWSFIKWLGILSLGLFIVNFILGNIWVLIHLIKYFFGS